MFHCSKNRFLLSLRRPHPSPSSCGPLSEATKDRAKLCQFRGDGAARALVWCESSDTAMTIIPPTGAQPPVTREGRVLLVDDDRELCQMLTEYLEAEHFEVTSVHDGADALAALKINDFEILIL